MYKIMEVLGKLYRITNFVLKIFFYSSTVTLDSNRGNDVKLYNDTYD